jgi:Zn-dependent peptidase ImmA (M78 family)
MAGFSLDDLARRTGNRISRQAIHKYEQSLMRPSSAVLLELCQALNLKPDYFYRVSEIELTKLSFRRKLGLAAKKEESLRLRTVDFLERFLELEDILGIDAKYRNPLKGLPVRNPNDIEAAAMKLRRAWSLGSGPICGLLEIIENNGIKIFEVEEDEGFDGLSASSKMHHVIVLNRNKSLDRRRFTAAHELGHILCDFAQHEDDLCHSFAKALLLPKGPFIRELKGVRKRIALREIIEIKEAYGVSLQAILHRAFDLGLITSRYRGDYERYLEKWKEDKMEPGHCRHEERASRFSRLLSYALAENIVSLSKAAQLADLSITQVEKEFQAY